MIHLTADQRSQLAHFEELARDLNQRLNLYSSASAKDFTRRHVTHALALASRPFPSGATVVDWGTGGGVPGIPLAIAFPDTAFVLIDAVEKKIRAVQTMARRLDLTNVETWSGRAERWEGRCTHSVSRATSPLPKLWSWHVRSRSSVEEVQEGWPPSLVCLKGGDLDQEIADLYAAHPDAQVEVTPLSNLLYDPYFATKAIVQVT